MKFKIGDKVKFIGKTTNHNSCSNDLEADIKKYNNIFTIAYISKSYIEFRENRFRCIGEDEIELVQEKQFTKADLKDGDIVTYRDGEKRTVIAKKLINSGGCIAKKLDNYTDELKDTISRTDLDIVKVERPVKYEAVFERKEEVLDETEKRYLSNIIRPFREKIKSIIKRTGLDREFISIKLKNEEPINLPYFKEGTMYKEMKKAKEYKLKELGL